MATRDLDAAEIARLTGIASAAPGRGTPGINLGTGADWMGPDNTMAPLAPEDVEGRQFDIPVGYNLQTRTRPYEPVSFQEMRALADAYDVLRMVIETRKDQMARLPWTIRAKTDAKGQPVAKVADAVIQEITDFFQRPDGVNSWTTWLRAVLEDMFVIDAASIYVHRDRGGKLLALEYKDGATFKPVIDDWGMTPKPPICAYQQILKGMPAVNYTTDDLIYLPRNRRTNHVYGYSPVEQLITTVNIGLRRLYFQLSYYESGNMPDGFVNAPEGWTSEQIAKTQTAWDRVRSGQAQERAGKVVFIPFGSKYVPAKDPDLTGKTDEWLARKVCFAFSIPPTPFVQQTNRATAQSAHDAALEEGLAPTQAWMKELVDDAISRGWPNCGAEFAWGDDAEVDGLVQMQILKGYTEDGIYTIDETRDVLGKDPLPDGAGAKARVKTPTGYVLLDVNDDAPTAGEAAEQKATQAQAMAEAAAKAPAPQPGAQPPTDKPAPQEEPAAKTFRGTARELRKGYWATKDPHRHAQPSRARGAAGRAVADREPDAGAR